MAFISRFLQTVIYCWAFIWRNPQIMAIKPSGNGQGITLMKLGKVEWWSTQPGLWKTTVMQKLHTQLCGCTQTRHIRAACCLAFSSVFFFIISAFMVCLVILLPFWLQLFCILSEHQVQPSYRCSTWGPVSSSGKVFLFVLSIVGSSQSITGSAINGEHTRINTYTSAPVTERCHSVRQL